jgi:hypothetical protein
MATFNNLHRNPALSVDATNWFGTGWARTASAHASLPRTTAWAGNTTGINPAVGRATTVPGKYYVLSFSVRAIGLTTGSLNMDWKTSGDTFLSTTSGEGSDYGVVNMTANSTQRFAVLGLAPTNGARLVPVAADWVGNSQITAVMVKQYDTLGEAQAGLLVDRLAANYFDGDTSGATWDGTTGLSASTLIADAPGTAATVFGAQTSAASRTRTYGVGATTFGAHSTVTGLISSVSYDSRRGRVRVNAIGLSPAVIRAEVSSRPVGTTRWSTVRGGKVGVADGRFARLVDDYEFVAGSGMEYRIQAISTAENVTPVDVVQTVIADIADTLDQVWVKYIVAPHRNRRVELIGWGNVSRASRQVVFGIRNRPDPVVVTDVHGSRVVDVELLTRTEVDGDELEESLAAGLPIFFQTPTNVPLRSMYASIGDITARRSGGFTSPRRIYTVRLTEVSAPPLSIVGPGITWTTLVEGYGSWEELSRNFESWLEVAG